MSSQPDFTINQLRVFAAVAKHGSLTRAASALAMPQPTISRLIGRLETVVQTPLLIRSRRGVALTGAGERFLYNAERALRYHDLAYAEVQDQRGTLVGEVRIAAPESVGNLIFAPLVKKFREKYKQAIIRAIASQSTAIPTMLDNDLVDIGIVADTPPRPSGHLEALFSEDFYLVGPSGAPEMTGSRISLAKAARLPLILNAMPGGFRHVTDTAFETHNLRPTVRFEMDANGPLLDLVSEGEGFSILPFSLLCHKGRAASLSALRIVNPVMSRRLSITMAKGRPVTPLWREAARQIRIVVQTVADQARWNLIRSPSE